MPNFSQFLCHYRSHHDITMAPIQNSWCFEMLYFPCLVATLTVRVIGFYGIGINPAEQASSSVNIKHYCDF